MGRTALFLFFLLLAPATLFAVWPLSWELGSERHYAGPFVTTERKGEDVFDVLLGEQGSAGRNLADDGNASHLRRGDGALGVAVVEDF